MAQISAWERVLTADLCGTADRMKVFTGVIAQIGTIQRSPGFAQTHPG
jgi:hypothetical protein